MNSSLAPSEFNPENPPDSHWPEDELPVELSTEAQQRWEALQYRASESVLQPLPPPDILTLGQIWQLKLEIDLRQYRLNDSPDDRYLQAHPSTIEHVPLYGIIAAVDPVLPLRMHDYQYLEVYPISEYTEYADDQDLILTADELELDDGDTSYLIEIWNKRLLLRLNLHQYLGTLATPIWAQVQTVADQWGRSIAGFMQELPLKPPDSPTTAFRATQRRITEFMSIPAEKVVELESFSQRCHATLNRRQFSAIRQTPSKTIFAIPKYHRVGPEKLTVVAASATEATQAKEVKPEIEQETIRLNENLLMDIWVRGELLEFRAYQNLGEFQPEVLIEYSDADGIRQSKTTDRFGTTFIPLNALSVEGISALFFHFEQQVYLYPLVFQVDE